MLKYVFDIFKCLISIELLTCLAKAEENDCKSPDKETDENSKVSYTIRILKTPSSFPGRRRL